MNKYLLLSLLFTSFLPVAAQDTAVSYPGGDLSGQWRTFYMATINKGSLKDYHALATGGFLRYEVRLSEAIVIGGALYNSTNLGLQDLTVPDASTGRISRYEEGLFDRLDLANDAVFLLGELYAALTAGKHDFRLGRVKINTPLINPQDGRMIPSLAQGFWYRFRPDSGQHLQFGILNRMAPRSTGEFMPVGESIGPYPAGRALDGSEARYPGNTDSDYVVLLNAQLQLTPDLSAVLWNQYVDNISNSFYLKPSLRISRTLYLDGEWLHQNRVGQGGNARDSLRYFTTQRSDILGVRLRHGLGRSEISIAYDRILPGGMFLSPREWGREDLFSFQKRERSEGSADNHALVVTYRKTLKTPSGKLRINTIASLGHHWKPPVEDPAVNKFAMPNYTHANLDLFFEIPALPGLRPELLLTAKFADANTPDVPGLFFNKAGLFHTSLVLNYNF